MVVVDTVVCSSKEKERKNAQHLLMAPLCTVVYGTVRYSSIILVQCTFLQIAQMLHYGGTTVTVDNKHTFTSCCCYVPIRKLPVLPSYFVVV